MQTLPARRRHSQRCFFIGLCLALGLGLGFAQACQAAEDNDEEEGRPRAIDLPFLGTPLPRLQELYADVLVLPQDKPPLPLAAGDAQAADLWRRLDAAQPGLRLPPPVRPPQLLRLLNEEMAAQGLAWEVRLRLDLAAEEDAAQVYSGVLHYGLPPDAALQQALAAGTLGQMLRALASSLHATVTPCAGGKILLVQGPSPQRLAAPMGTVRPVVEMQRDFADLLLITQGRKFADFALPGDDPRTVAMVRRLRELKLPRRPPEPVLFTQMLRFLNAEMARQQVPYEVCIDFDPGVRAKVLDNELYSLSAAFATRPDGEVTVGSCLAWLEKLNKGMLLCTDGRRIQVRQGAESWFPVETLVQEPNKTAPAKQHSHRVQPNPSPNVSHEKR